jgi:V/A-type H+/Na+-transporting ATPase subunit I
MITTMQKVTVICIREHQEATLLALQKMGVLHLEHIQEPAGSLLEETRAYQSDVHRASEVLEHYAELTDPNGPAPVVDPTRSAESVVDEIWKWINLRKNHTEALENWQREIARVEPFGNFDPAQVKALAEKGWHVGLFKAGPKQEIRVPEQATLTIHQEDREGVRFSVISREPLDLPYESVALPPFSLDHMREKVTEQEQALREAEAALAALAGYLPVVRDIVDHVGDKVQFLEARTGMGAVAPLAYLRGYCPERDVQRIRDGAKALGWGLLIEPVSAKDRVPTKIENPGWVKPIRTVFSFIGVVPGYEEVDISAVFLLFFSFFFAMIVGDAGYGALFLAGTFWARKKFKKAPASPFHLLYITSIATIVWGVLSGNYFGIASLPGPMLQLKIDWLADTRFIMGLCFLIGAIHLTIAHTWNVFRNRFSVLALAQIGWICVVWTMFFLALQLVLSVPFPSFMMPVFGVGVVLLVLFMTPVAKIKEEWFNHVMLPLNLVSAFVDVVSYVRLFAVGTATLAVASAFNGMGAGMAESGWVGGLIGAVVIFLGHTLNILLAAMGVLVHGIRLNTLEFAGHLGLQWTGVRFTPFSQKSSRAPLLNDVVEESPQG